MQKECFSLPAIKATIFLYEQSKNIYLYEFMYRYIHAMGSGAHLEYLLHAIQTPGSPSEKDYRALWDMRQSWNIDGKDLKHACSNHLPDTFRDPIPHIYSLTPLKLIRSLRHYYHKLFFSAFA